MEYRYRPGHEIRGLPAQVVGETIAGMSEARGGRIMPGEVVDDARPAGSPLHAAFEWDDGVAAELHREAQARQMIRSYFVVRVDDRGAEREVIANVSVARPYDRDGPAYMPTMTALEDPALRARILDQARTQLEAWTHRYGHLQELAAIVEAIRNARAAQAAARPGRGRRRAAGARPAAATA